MSWELVLQVIVVGVVLIVVSGAVVAMVVTSVVDDLMELQRSKK